MHLRSHLFATRAMLAGVTWFQLAVLANPTADVLASYPHTYANWSALGDEGDWTARLAVVTLIGTMALFRWRVWNMTRAIRMLAAAMQGGLFLAAGIMFGTTHPPQVGVCYVAVSAYCFWLAWVSWCAEID